MSKLRVHVLGGLHVFLGPDRPITIPARKAQALLAYLATCPRPQSRDKLAFLLWEESTEVQARASLRQALAVLRKALCPLDGDPIVSSADTIAVRADLVGNDAIEFERLVDAGTPEDLERAIEFYKGDFLEAFHPRAPAFEDWLRAERQRLRERAVDVMSSLLAYHMASGATERAVGVAVRLLVQDPLQESVHRTLMQLYSRQGRGASALRQFQICREILERELGERPEPDTERLYRDIQQQRRGRTGLVASQVRAPLGPGAIEVVPRTESGLPQVAIPATGPVRVEPAVPLPGKASIAVLPFDNMSGDPEQEYFSDGLTEDLITDLSQLSELLVTSRHAVFQYKNQMVGPRQVAEDLGVRYVLEGSVRRAAGRVRINAQLIDATSGYHVWADRYDGGAEDVFALQDTITQAIVGALELRLIGGKRTGRRYTDNLEAYDLFLQARESHLLRRTKDAAARARVALERAIELDPGFAAAHSLLAENYRQEWVFGWRSDPELLNHCLALARDAVRLDDGASHAHMVLGWIHLWRKEFEPAVVEARRSVALDPGHVEAWARLGHIVEQAGGPEEGLLLIEKALRLDPHHPFIYPFWLGHALLYLERDEEALSAFQRSRNRSPDFVAAHEFAAATLALLGRLDEARRATAATLHLRPDYSIRHQAKIMPYRDQAPLARLIEGWRKAGLPE